jgi:hypothetical protein
VEIRNLLATEAFNEVSVGEVNGILSRAKLEAREVVPELTAIYQHAALILAADRDLTAADRAALDNLQHAFQLTDSEASAARADATSDIFKRTIFEAVADGQWSPADQAKADATATALGLPDKQAREVFQTAAMAAMRASFAAAVADRRLHGSEKAQARGRRLDAGPVSSVTADRGHGRTVKPKPHRREECCRRAALFHIHCSTRATRNRASS